MTKSTKERGITPIGIIILLVIGFLWLSNYLTSPERAYKELDEYLKKQYGEEFVIGHMGRRKLNDKEWYEAGVVYPKRYVGTVRENDTYYWGRGFVEILGGRLDPGDSYGGVLLNESANEFYLPKLKELFGENVLPILNIKGGYDYTDFQKELKVRDKVISGGIYIFGRVENNKDREWYRKQIYEFVQFMKQTGTFEYTAIAFNVLDERVLSKEFQENTKLQQELVDMGNKLAETNHSLYRQRKREMMSQLPKNLTPYIKMEDINKTDIVNTVSWSYYNNLLSLPLYSEKYIRANGLEDTRRISKYEKVEDVFFTYEDY